MLKIKILQRLLAKDNLYSIQTPRNPLPQLPHPLRRPQRPLHLPRRGPQIRPRRPPPQRPAKAPLTVPQKRKQRAPDLLAMRLQIGAGRGRHRQAVERVEVAQRQPQLLQERDLLAVVAHRAAGVAERDADRVEELERGYEVAC